MIVTDVRGYLVEKGQAVHKAAGQEVTVHCIFCPDGDPKGKGKLYINAESWQYHCKRCGASGGQRSLMKQFGDEPDEAPRSDGTLSISRKMNILTLYAARAHEGLLNNDAALSYLLDRGLTAETIVTYQLGYVPRGYALSRDIGAVGDFSQQDLVLAGVVGQKEVNGSTSTYEFLGGKIVIPYLSGDRVVQLRGKDIERGGYFTPAGDPVRLFNADVLRGAERVMVTEGEFDCLVLQQALEGTGVVVVALPGTQSWPGGPTGFPAYFEDAKRTYIGFDQDEAGRKAAPILRDAIGARARIVKLPEDERYDTAGKLVACDWTEFLREQTTDHPFGGHGPNDVKALLHVADQEGKKLSSMGELVTRWDTMNRTPGYKLGFAALDATIFPGPRAGNLIIPVARTGVGKTVFLANLCWNMRGLDVLHVTLENTGEEFFDVMRRVYNFSVPLGTPYEIEQWLPNMRVYDRNELSFPTLQDLLEEYREDVGRPPQVINVDYLGYFANSVRGSSDYERTSGAVMQLKRYAKETRTLVICPSQVNRSGEDGTEVDISKTRDSGKVEETGDFLFGLHRPSMSAVERQARADGAVDDRFVLGIGKSRRGGMGKKIPLAMSLASLKIADLSDRRAVLKIKAENDAINRGKRYEEILAEQRERAKEAQWEHAQVRLGEG